MLGGRNIFFILAGNTQNAFSASRNHCENNNGTQNDRRMHGKWSDMALRFDTEVLEEKSVVETRSHSLDRIGD